MIVVWSQSQTEPCSLWKIFVDQKMSFFFQENYLWQRVWTLFDGFWHVSPVEALELFESDNLFNPKAPVDGEFI